MLSALGRSSRPRLMSTLKKRARTKEHGHIELECLARACVFRALKAAQTPAPGTPERSGRLTERHLTRGGCTRANASLGLGKGMWPCSRRGACVRLAPLTLAPSHAWRLGVGGFLEGYLEIPGVPFFPIVLREIIRTLRSPSEPMLNQHHQKDGF